MTFNYLIDENITSGIYAITNNINPKPYIGSTKHFKNRYRGHVRDLKEGNHHSGYFQNFINKNPDVILSFCLLEECPVEDLLAVEQKWLNDLETYKRDKGFNICPVAGRPKGVPRKTGLESPSWGLKFEGNTYPSRRRAIIQTDNCGKIIKEFSSTEEAAQELGLNKVSIRANCDGRLPSIKGFYFRYRDNPVEYSKENVIAMKNRPKLPEKFITLTKDGIEVLRGKLKDITDFLQISWATLYRIKRGETANHTGYVIEWIGGKE